MKSKKYFKYKKHNRIFVTLLVVFNIFLFPSMSHSYAYAGSVSISIGNNPSLNLFSTTGNNFGTAFSNVTVSTDNTTGYTLTFNSSGTNTDLLNDDIDYTDPNNSNLKFTNLLAPTTQANCAANTWGYNVNKTGPYLKGDLNTFIPVPASDATDEARQIEVTDNEGSNTYTFTYGAKADDSLPAGTYSTSIILAATANEAPDTGPYTINYYRIADGTITGTDDPTVDDYSLWKTEEFDSNEITIISDIPEEYYASSNGEGHYKYTFTNWNTSVEITDSQEASTFSGTGKTYNSDGTYVLDPADGNVVNLYALYRGTYTGCVTADTLITLANGDKKRVADLTGEEELLVWDFDTASFSAAPIVFIEPEKERDYNVIHLYFSDQSDVEVVYEHGFFDYTLGKFIYINDFNPERYIGDSFIMQDGDSYKTVELTNIEHETKRTSIYGLTTFKHFNFFNNDMLSIEGNIAGMFNYFDVDLDTMGYDQAKKQADIEEYGLLTYEDFDGIIDEVGFEAYNGQYLNVSIGKGLITWNGVKALAERYGHFTEKED